MSDTQKVGEEESNNNQGEALSPEEAATIDVTNENSASDGLGADYNSNKKDSDQQIDLEKATLLLEDARNKADEHWDQCLRLTAELENLRQRHERELEKAHKYALDNFSQELLPVVDSLELGLNAANEENADAAKLLTEGSALTLKLLKTALRKFGIKEVNPIGEAFNPELHQAMATQESDKVSPNTVLNVYQKGYLLNERVVRPAMVVVAKANQTDADEAASDTGNGTKSGATKVKKNGRKNKKGSKSAGSLGTQIDEQA